MYIPLNEEIEQPDKKQAETEKQITTTNENEEPEKKIPEEKTEIDTLRKAYDELKEEVERLKRPQEGQARMRAVGLRILQQRIESTLEEGKIGMLQARLIKAEQALTNERMHSAELQSKLSECVNVQENISTTKARLKKSEHQLGDLKVNYQELKLQLETSDAQLKEQLRCEQSLRASICEEKQKVENLMQENKKIESERLMEVGNLKTLLEEAHAKLNKSEARAVHLEKLLVKITEDPISEDSTRQRQLVQESATVSTNMTPKSNVPLPDPPSEEESPRKLINAKSGGDSSGVQKIIRLAETEAEAQKRDQPLIDRPNTNHESAQTLDSHHVEQERAEQDSETSREASEQVEGNRKWGVLSLWGYVTGE